MELRTAVVVMALAASVAVPAEAGYQLGRYEPTPAGEAFHAVQSPWYREARGFSLGLTFDYGRNVLLGGTTDAATGTYLSRAWIIEHQWLAHLDAAFAFGDRVQLSASIPFTLAERGSAAYGVAPISGTALGDPRLGFAVRLMGHAEQDPFSLHAAASVWLPAGGADQHAGDPSGRLALRLIAAGMASSNLRWAANLGYLFRRAETLTYGLSAFGRSASELQLGAAVAFVTHSKGFQAGPELVFSAPAGDNRAFERDGTNLELLLGGSFWIAQRVRVGPAVGLGLIRSAGMPSVRPLLRIAYAPKEEAR